MKIKAAIVRAPFDAFVGEVEASDPGPDDLVLRTEYSFASNGTERHVHLREFPDSPVDFPLVIGYQSVGCIESVGSNVSNLKVGQRVFARNNKVTGISNALGGAHAQTMVCAASGVIPIPDEVESLEASALIVAQVGYNVASRLPEQTDGPVLVIGDGIIGQFTAQALLARGFPVIMAGHHNDRLERARESSGELQVINAGESSLPELPEQRDGGLVKMVVDTVGSPDTIQESLEIIPRFGHLAIAGWWGGKGQQILDVHRVFGKEPTLYFPAGVELRRMLATIELMRTSKIKVKPLVTHTFEGADFQKACRLLGGSNRDYLGIAIRWA